MSLNYWGKLIIFALLLRILLAAFLYHPDLKWIYAKANLASQGVVTAYEQSVKDNNPMVYPPPIYLFLHWYQKTNPIIFNQNFEHWLNDWSPQQTDNNHQLFRELLFMKLPFIFFDLAIVFLLVKLVPQDKQKLIATLWLFNPFSIYSIYAFSQFDVIPTVLVLTSVYFLKEKKYPLSYAILGIASGFKVFPLLLLPFWILSNRQSIKNNAFYLCIFFVTLGICFLPILNSPIAFKSIFLSNLTSGLFNLSFDLGEGKKLSIYLTLYALFLFSTIFNYLKKQEIETQIVIVLLSLFGLSSFHSQWMLWLMPFVLILMVKNIVDWKSILYLGLSFLAASILTKDKFVGLGILKAINNGFDTIESPRWYLDKIGLGANFQMLFASLFLGLVIIVLVKILLESKAKNELKVFDSAFLFSCWIGVLFTLILGAHIPLTYKAAYMSTNHLNQYERISLESGTTISQDIPLQDNNFTRLEIRLKNKDYQNTNNYLISIKDKETQEERSFKINGKTIGDDYNLQLDFPKFTHSRGKMYTLKISPEGTVNKEETIILPYDKTADNYQLMVNDQEIPGSISFATYYNSKNLLDNVSHTIKNIPKRI